jgi:hypothetical protein
LKHINDQWDIRQIARNDGIDRMNELILDPSDHKNNAAINRGDNEDNSSDPHGLTTTNRHGKLLNGVSGDRRAHSRDHIRRGHSTTGNQPARSRDHTRNERSVTGRKNTKDNMKTSDNSTRNDDNLIGNMLRANDSASHHEEHDRTRLVRLMRGPFKLRERCEKTSNKSNVRRKERVQEKAKATQRLLRRAMCPMETTIIQIRIGHGSPGRNMS